MSRSERAMACFSEGYNCTQSVVLAFADRLPVDRDTLMALCSSFGGGMGRLREVCGAVSGMTFMAGVISPAANPSDAERKKANYALVQDFAAEFSAENGSIICRELLQLRAGQKESPAPSTRDAQWYTSRPCERLVGYAARIVAQRLACQK